MKSVGTRFGLLMLLTTGLSGGCGQTYGPSSGGNLAGTEAERLRGPYLGQQVPGPEPEVFAPGIVSTAAFELNSAFTPRGDELYQTLVVSGWSFSAIIRYRQEEKGWGEPEVAPFSGRYNDIDPNLSPDGNSIVFISRRPSSPSDEQLSEAWDIWVSYREDTQSPWLEAQRLPEPVNSPDAELYPSIAASENLYFGSNRDGGFGGFDIYRAKMIDGGYREVENLGAKINSEHAETDAFIAPDESYIVVTVTGRSDSRGQNDLYISFRQENGNWGDLIHLGDSINSPAKEYCPVVTPDNRFFFFTRGKNDQLRLHSNQRKSYRELAEKTYTWRNNLENIYWVDSEVLRSKKPPQP